MLDPNVREAVETAITQAIAPVNVRMGLGPELRFAPISEAKLGEAVTVSARDYEEMAERACSELGRCGHLVSSVDENVVVGKIMRARRMKLNSRWQTYDVKTIPEGIFAALHEAGVLVNVVSA